MPTIGIETYNIDFLILESNDPKTIVLLDRSTYLTTPEKPRLEVTPPGFTGYIEIPYNINGITILDSDSLLLTANCEYVELADLPDGVWIIKQKVCPYDELFIKKYYLKTQCLEHLYNSALLKMGETNIDCDVISGINTMIIEIEILLKTAKLEAARGNVRDATKKYQYASKRINKFIKSINGC